MNCVCTVSFNLHNNPLEEKLLSPDGDTQAQSSTVTCPRSPASQQQNVTWKSMLCPLSSLITVILAPGKCKTR